MKMIQREYALRFYTPAFLGNAEQSGQWRTPPFKAQLRQWWRVAYAANQGFRPDVVRMREEEGKLFGNAWLDDNFSKSLVRIRLRQWSEGKLKTWEAGDPTVPHQNVPKPIGSQLYLGFGPLVFRGGTALKANAAIQAGEQNTFSIAYPDQHAPLIEKALALMSRFGAVGGRSRNGWGSYSLYGIGDASNLPLRPWQEALKPDFGWPHAIGCDSKGALVWQTQPFDDWKTVMKELAVLKIGLRTQFVFTTGKNAQRTEERHWLSYPVTNHSVSTWVNNARLPNSLRFKVCPVADGKLVGVIFHMPCLPPPAFKPDAQVITAVWEQVHAFLDAPARKLQRIRA